jgi:hypothetical protein
LGVSEQTYYRWRKEYGGMRTSQVRKLKDLEKENARLKKLVADLSLDNAILKEAISGNRSAQPGDAGRLSVFSGPWASPSAGLVRFLHSPDQHSDIHVIKLETRLYSQNTSSSWRASTAAMDTAGSLRCSETRAGG